MFGLQEFGRLFIMSAGILGNGCIIRAITKNAHMQTFGNKLLLVIALLDLGFCIFIMPFSLISMCTGRWLFGSKLCNLFAFLTNFFIQTLFLMVALVVFEKHFHIAHTNLSRLSKRGISLVICLLGITSCTFSFPNYPRIVMYEKEIAMCVLVYSHKSAETVFGVIETALFKVIPCALILVSFVKIFKAIRMRKQASMTRKKNMVLACCDIEDVRLMTDAYSACTTFLFAVSFLIFSLPRAIAYGYLTYLMELDFARGSLKVAACWCMLINPVLRPLIYLFRNQRCRTSIARYYERIKRRFFKRGFCLGSAGRARAYVMPTTEVIELKPGALAMYGNIAVDVRSRSLPSGASYNSRNGAISLAVAGSPSFVRNNKQSVFALKKEHIGFEIISEDCPSRSTCNKNDISVEDIEAISFAEIQD